VRIVLASTITDGGGVWRHQRDLATGLVERGCRVDLSLPKGAESPRADAHDRGLSVILPSAHPKADIVHVHQGDTYDRTSWQYLARARLGGATTLLTEHLPRTNASDPTAVAPGETSSRGAQAAKTAFKRSEFALCARVLAVSKASRSFLLDRYRLAPDKVVAIPNGVEPTAGPAPWADGPVTFVAIGSVIRQKGFDVLVEAAALAKAPWEVEVVGEGAHRESLQARADQLGVGVRFSGHCTDVTSAIARSTALVAPSRWESSSYVALEAMQEGRAVVASEIDAFPEIVADGETGLLVPPEDPAALAGALDRLARDPVQARWLGRAGHVRLAQFGLDQMVEGVLNEYRSVLRVREAKSLSTGAR
jgi:glycosyltransferase involved in cell wall biosynthesis